MKRIPRLFLSLLLILALSLSFGGCAGFPSDLFPEGPGNVEGPPDKPQSPTPTEGELAIHFIDVDQADAILILDGDKTMMIDTGNWPDDEHKDYMLDYIKDLGVTVIDYLVLTHPDADHIGGAPEVINTFDVKNCIMPDCTKTSKVFERTVAALENKNVNVLLPEVGDDYTLKNATFRILAPLEENYSDTNDYSVVLRMQYGERSILFTGDAEAASEAQMVARYTAADLGADVLKVGHHGSRTSSSQSFLELVDPDYAVICCGVDNSYGHPHSPVITRLTGIDAEIYRTDRDGTVVLLTDGETLEFTKLGKK